MQVGAAAASGVEKTPDLYEVIRAYLSGGKEQNSNNGTKATPHGLTSQGAGTQKDERSYAERKWDSTP